MNDARERGICTKFNRSKNLDFQKLWNDIDIFEKNYNLFTNDNYFFCEMKFTFFGNISILFFSNDGRERASFTKLTSSKKHNKTIFLKHFEKGFIFFKKIANFFVRMMQENEKFVQNWAIPKKVDFFNNFET